MSTIYLEDNLAIYKRESTFYMRLKTALQHYVHRSLRTANQTEARNRARRHLVEFEIKQERGELFAAPTLKQVIDEYTKMRERDHERGNTSTAMLRQIKRVNRFWLEYAGHLRIDKIRNKELQDFIPWRKAYYGKFAVKPKNAKLHPQWRVPWRRSFDPIIRRPKELRKQMFWIVYIHTMNLNGFDLNLLRVLNALLAEQSTVRAAERVGLSQSAVSAALGRLRGALDDPLFVRHGQRIVPTDFARSLEVPLKAILDDLESLLLQHGDFDPAAVAQSFKIAASDFFAVMLMPPLADILSRRAPQMQVQLVDLLPASYVGILERPGIDLALVPKNRLPTVERASTAVRVALRDDSPRRPSTAGAVWRADLVSRADGPVLRSGPCGVLTRGQLQVYGRHCIGACRADPAGRHYDAGFCGRLHRHGGQRPCGAGSRAIGAAHGTHAWPVNLPAPDALERCHHLHGLAQTQHRQRRPPLVPLCRSRGAWRFGVMSDRNHFYRSHFYVF